MLAGRALRVPAHLSVLHVEQEVAGDDTVALDSVLECDIKRNALLAEEKQIMARLQATTNAARYCVPPLPPSHPPSPLQVYLVE